MGTSAETLQRGRGVKSFSVLFTVVGKMWWQMAESIPNVVIFSSLPVAFSKAPIRFGCADKYKHCTVNINGLLYWKPGFDNTHCFRFLSN